MQRLPNYGGGQGACKRIVLSPPAWREGWPRLPRGHPGGEALLARNNYQTRRATKQGRHGRTDAQASVPSPTGQCSAAAPQNMWDEGAVTNDGALALAEMQQLSELNLSGRAALSSGGLGWLATCTELQHL